MSERRIEMAPEVARYFAALVQEANVTAARRDASYTTILLQAGITGGAMLQSVEGPVLVVTVPDEAT